MVNIQGKTSEVGKLQPWQESRGMAPPRDPRNHRRKVQWPGAFWGRHHTTSIRGHIQQVSKDKCKTKHGFAAFNSTRLLVHGDHQQVPVCHIVRAPSTCQPKWPKLVPNQAVARIHTASQEDTGRAHRNNFQVSQDASHSVMARPRNRRRSEVLHHLEEWPRS